MVPIDSHPFAVMVREWIEYHGFNPQEVERRKEFAIGWYLTISTLPIAAVIYHDQEQVFFSVESVIGKVEKGDAKTFRWLLKKNASLYFPICLSVEDNDLVMLQLRGHVDGFKLEYLRSWLGCWVSIVQDFKLP